MHDWSFAVQAFDLEHVILQNLLPATGLRTKEQVGGAEKSESGLRKARAVVQNSPENRSRTAARRAEREQADAVHLDKIVGEQKKYSLGTIALDNACDLPSVAFYLTIQEADALTVLPVALTDVRKILSIIRSLS